MKTAGPAPGERMNYKPEYKPSLESSFSDLLPVRQTEGRALVNARDLHWALEVGRDFSTWIKSRLEEIDARMGSDFVVLDDSPVLRSIEPEYNNRRIDYALTLTSAKEIAMLERNDRGKAIRRYFIDCEERLNQSRLAPPATLTRLEILEQALAAERANLALQLENRSLESRVLEQTPKAEAFDALQSAEGSMLVSEAARILGTGEVRLYEFLRRRGVLIATGSERNRPYQQHVDNGRFLVRAGSYTTPDGELRATSTTRVTPKGLEYIRKLITEWGAP